MKILGLNLLTDKQLKDEYFTKQEYNNLKNDNLRLMIDLDTERIGFNMCYNELISLKREKYPHNCLTEFKEYLEENLKTTLKYQTQSDGSRIYPHKFLVTDDETNGLYDTWLQEKGLIRNDLSSDDAVKNLIVFIHALKVQVGYKTDKEAWGVLEKWLSPREAFQRAIIERKGMDCEDWGNLEFKAVERMLVARDEWEQNKWRLRGFLVYIIGSGYHYSVAWVKNELNDWINLETTYAEDCFIDCWDNNKGLSGNWLYQIDYSFDQETCYKKI